MGYFIMLYEWNSLEDFNTWHTNLCADLGYPLIGVNAHTGLPDEKITTTEYTRATQCEDKWVAEVEDIYSDGLTQTMLDIPRVEIV